MHKLDIGINTEDKEIQFNYVSAKKKLKDAMDGKITQTRLAEITGIPQGRISACLNENNSDFFTFEQMYRICSALGLSMDEITGLGSINDTKNRLTPRKLCKAILEAYTHFNEYGLDFIDADIDECFSTTNPSNYSFATNDLVMQKIKKHAIVFKIGCGLEEKNRLADGSYLVNAENQTVVRINAFLDHLVKLDKLRIDGSIDNEDFELLINKRLADIPDI